MPYKSAFERIDSPVLVSACLLGIPCRYNGLTKSHPEIYEQQDRILIPICPEQLGGLPTPRPPAYFVGGDGQDVLKNRAKLINDEGSDVTQHFINGAINACRIAQLLKVRWAILKEDSPSCGTHRIWTKEELVDGMGVTSAMLKDLGISLINEDGVL